MLSLSFQDVEKLFDLPRLLDNYEVPLKGFNHVDFIWGIDADELIYKKIFDYFDGFTKLDVEHLEQLYASKRETVERVMPEREEVEEEEEARLLNGQHAHETLSFKFPTFPEN